MKHIGEFASAAQSSLSSHSLGTGEAANAISGFAPNGYAFHTASEFEPWWVTDLGKDHPLIQIRIFKRLGYEGQYRKADLTVSVSRDLEKWTTLDSEKADETFSQIIYNTSPVNCRFIKIRYKSGPLYLQKVEAYEDEEVVTFRGALIGLDKRARAFRGNLEKATYELPEIKWAQRLIDPSDRILEIGASIGAMSCAICSAFPEICYTAVEANPEVFESLKANHLLNKSKCKLINAAVTSSSSDTIEFFTSDNFLSSSLHKRKNASGSTMVNAIAFDKLVEDCEPSVLICDCEGAEYDIFNKATRFDGIDKIIIEMHPSEGDVIELFEKITALGYTPLSKIPAKNTLTVAAFKR